MKKLIAVAAVLVALVALTSSANSTNTAAPTEKHTTSHVKRVVLGSLASRQLGEFTFAGADRIRSRATGKVIGFDSFTGRYNPETDRVRIWVGIALRGGTMQGFVTASGDDPTFRGRILNGTGRFHGVRGTITGSERGNRTFVTLRYRV